MKYHLISRKMRHVYIKEENQFVADYMPWILYLDILNTFFKVLKKSEAVISFYGKGIQTKFHIVHTVKWLK